MTDRIICLAFAIFFAQAPNYIAQYVDVLSGAHMEAERTFTKVSEQAMQFGMQADEYIRTTIEDTAEGSPARQLIEVTANTVKRFYNYQKALTAIKNATPWARPFVLLQHYDPQIHSAIDFEANLPITVEGGVYALIGLVIALLFISLFKYLFGVIFGTKKRNTPKTEYRSLGER